MNNHTNVNIRRQGKIIMSPEIIDCDDWDTIYFLLCEHFVETCRLYDSDRRVWILCGTSDEFDEVDPMVLDIPVYVVVIRTVVEGVVMFDEFQRVSTNG